MNTHTSECTRPFVAAHSWKICQAKNDTKIYSPEHEIICFINLTALIKLKRSPKLKKMSPKFVQLSYLPVYRKVKLWFLNDFVFFQLWSSRCTNADRGSCYGYMSYRCFFHKQVLVFGEPSPIFPRGTESLLMGFFLQAQTTRCVKRDKSSM